MIKDIKEAGKVTLLAMIRKCEQSKTNKGTPYLSLILEDSSGELDAKYWNLTEEVANQFHVGMIVEASGDVILYRNAFQFRIQKMVEKTDEKITDYVRSAPMKTQDIQAEIQSYLDSMENTTLYELTSSIIKEHEEAYYSYPAATRNHHNFVGGLAFHSLSMARLAIQIANQYEYLDRDLLIAGTLLHDIGKITELSDPILPSYTAQGNLLGHISIMNCMVGQAASKLGVQDEECVMLLKHMILSHHGKQEFGSPVSPMIPEAEVLSMVDDLDARLYMMRESINVTEPGQFGPRVFALEGRMIYRRKGEEE
jgi:3'-5' exoribonuclease